MRHYALVAAMVGAWLPLSPVMAKPMNGYTMRSTTMLSGPDFNYPAVQRLGGDVGITVYGCLRDWSWCDVGARASRGWVAGHDIVVNYQGRRQSITPTMGIGILSFVFRSYWDSHYRGRPFYSQRPRFERQYNTDQRPRWGTRPRTPGIVPPRGQPDHGARHDITRPRPNLPPPQASPRKPTTIPQQRQPGPAGQAPQAHPGGWGNGNRDNGQAPGQQRGGPQGRPNQNQQPGN